MGSVKWRSGEFVELDPDWQFFFSPDLPESNQATDQKYAVATTDQKFECYKSFNETQTFTKEKDKVVYTTLWRYADIVFPKDRVPLPNGDGHYLNIDVGDDVEYWDAKGDDFRIDISDTKLKKKVLKTMNSNNYEVKMEKLGFTLDTTYNIRPSDDGWARVTITNALSKED